MSEPAAPADDSGQKAAMLIAYGLFLLAFVNGVTALAGVILVYVKRGEARGTLWESHSRNLIRVFWIAMAVVVALVFVVLESFGGLFFSLAATNGNPPPPLVGALFLLVPVLFLVSAIFAIWYFYRTLRGFILALESRPY